MNAENQGEQLREHANAIDALQRKISDLERLKRDLFIGLPIAALFITVFLGYQWKEVPKKIDAAMQGSGLEKATKRVELLESSAKGHIAKITEIRASAEEFDLPGRVDALSQKFALIDRIGSKQEHTSPEISVTEGRAGWEMVKRCPDGYYVAGVGGRGGGGGKYCYNCVDIIKFVCEPFHPKL